MPMWDGSTEGRSLTYYTVVLAPSLWCLLSLKHRVFERVFHFHSILPASSLDRASPMLSHSTPCSPALGFKPFVLSSSCSLASLAITPFLQTRPGQGLTALDTRLCLIYSRCIIGTILLPCGNATGSTSSPARNGCSATAGVSQRQDVCAKAEKSNTRGKVGGRTPHERS